MKFSLETNINKNVKNKEEALGLFSGMAERVIKELQDSEHDGGTGTIHYGYYWKLEDDVKREES